MDQSANMVCQSHEKRGIVEQAGQGVILLKKGDRVVIPFNVVCGRCLNCEEGRTAFCTGVNPGFAVGAYGYIAMDPCAGGQVFSPFSALSLPLSQCSSGPLQI